MTKRNGRQQEPSEMGCIRLGLEWDSDGMGRDGLVLGKDRSSLGMNIVQQNTLRQVSLTAGGALFVMQKMFKAAECRAGKESYVPRSVMKFFSNNIIKV